MKKNPAGCNDLFPLHENYVIGFCTLCTWKREKKRAAFITLWNKSSLYNKRKNYV